MAKNYNLWQIKFAILYVQILIFYNIFVYRRTSILKCLYVLRKHKKNETSFNIHNNIVYKNFHSNKRSFTKKQTKKTLLHASKLSNIYVESIGKVKVISQGTFQTVNWLYMRIHLEILPNQENICKRLLRIY